VAASTILHHDFQPCLDHIILNYSIESKFWVIVNVALILSPYLDLGFLELKKTQGNKKKEPSLKSSPINTFLWYGGRLTIALTVLFKYRPSVNPKLLPHITKAVQSAWTNPLM
jgi:hypothetical protein